MTRQSISLIPLIILPLVAVIVVVVHEETVIASTVEIPTYSDKYPVTGPNGTTSIDFENGSDTVSFPFVNETATVNITEYQTCVVEEQEQRLQVRREMDINTLDRYWIGVEKNDSMITMQNCIYLNSANQG